MKITLALLALTALARPAIAADYTLDLKPETTKINWTLSDVLHTVNGTFKLKHGSVQFNPETGKASGQIVVDVPSGQSGSDARDHRMHQNVLESAKYPEATFAPTRVEGALTVPGTSNVKLIGSFTIHGASHEIAVDVQAVTTADSAKATIKFEIPYVAWGMKDPGNFLLKVGKTVQMSIDASGSLQKR